MNRMQALVLLLSLAVAGMAPAAEEFRALNVIPFSPGCEKRLAADCVEYAKRTGNREVLYSMTLHPEGKPAMAKPLFQFESYRKLKRELEGTDVKLGILLQAVLGHWPRVDRELEPWMRTVNIDGEKVRFCPLDPGFADYIRTLGRMSAAEKPSFILGDDDIRAFSPKAECFCERHRRIFCERMGRAYTEAEFRQAVAASQPGDKVHTVFVSLQQEMVEHVCRLLRTGIDEVDPTIPAGVCMAWSEKRFSHRHARAIAAKGQRPVLRLGNSSYLEAGESFYNWNMTYTLQLAAFYRDKGVDFYDETDTCPQNLWSKSAVSMQTHLVTAMMCGAAGAKLWYVNAHKGEEPVSRAYTDILSERQGFNRTLSRELRGATLEGFTMPCNAAVPKGAFPTVGMNFGAGASVPVNEASPFGVPLRASFALDERQTVYSLTSKEETDLFTDDQIRSLLSCRVLVDGEAAVELTRRGFGDLIGCEATPDADGFTAELDEESGRRIILAPSSKPARLKAHDGARTVSTLIYVPFSGATTFDRIAPGALVFTNRLGGTVATIAYRHDTSGWHRHNEARKRWLVKILDILNGGPVPFVCGNAQHAAVLVNRLPAGGHIVTVCNFNPEPMRQVGLRLPKDAHEVSVLLHDGTWRPLEAKPDADGYAWLDVTLGCYDTTAFKVM